MALNKHTKQRISNNKQRRKTMAWRREVLTLASFWNGFLKSRAQTAVHFMGDDGKRCYENLLAQRKKVLDIAKATVHHSQRQKAINDLMAIPRAI